MLCSPVKMQNKILPKCHSCPSVSDLPFSSQPVTGILHQMKDQRGASTFHVFRAAFSVGWAEQRRDVRASMAASPQLIHTEVEIPAGLCSFKN